MSSTPDTATSKPDLRNLLPDDDGPRVPGWALAAMLLICLMVCLPSLLVGLGEGDSRHTMENISLLSAQETFLRLHGWHDIPREPEAWLMPTRNGEPRVTKPPMLVWLSLLSWADLTPETSDTSLLTLRARYASVLTGLIMLAAIFWLGSSLGDYRLALMATLAAGSIWFFQRQARYASYDIQFTAWATLSIAGAIWAMKPQGGIPSVSRRLVGWIVAGLALALSWMTKGPLAIVVVLLPVIGAIFALGRERLRHMIWFTGALALAAALTLPWHYYAIYMHEQASRVWAREFRAQRDEFQPPYYYLGLLGLLMPWTLWLIGGLFQPFVRAQGDRRRLRLVAWIWFVAIFVFFSIPGAKQQRYILPILPAAVLLIAQVWRDHAELARRGRSDPESKNLWLPHWIMLLVGGVLFVPFIFMDDVLYARGWIDREMLGPISYWEAGLASVALVLLAWFGWTWHARNQVMRAALASAAWAVLASTVALHAYTRADHRFHPVRPDAERVAHVVQAQPMRYLRVPGNPLLLNEELLFYSRRIVPSVRPEELQTTLTLGTVESPLFMLGDINEESDRILRETGLRQVMEFQEDYDQRKRLWVYPAQAPVTVPPEPEGLD